jgi:alpha,alpha-trehalase
LALHAGRRYLIIDDSNLNENPVRRLTRQMKEFYWKNLTQVTNGANLEKVLQDPKDWTPRPRPRIYIPRSQPFLHDYYTSLAQQQPSCDLDVQWLPSNDIPAFAAGKYEHPGLVVLSHREAAANRDENGETSIRSVPFVVPHGHAHEFHGWQSYSTFLGLLAQDETDLAEAMIENYCFCIHHYGRVPQSGRLHHMTQSQPPFLTSMALSLYNKLSDRASALKMLETAIAAAIKEYYTVWMAPPRWDPVSRLSRYASEGTTIPQEEELAPFVPILKPLAERRNLTIDEFVIAYNSRQILEPELDEYLRHYRASMESGHHRSNRMEGVAADIATVDLNCLLYKYEVDIADAISTCFSGRLDVPVDYSYPYESGFQPPGRETSAKWRVYAHNRQVCMNKFMWDEWQGMYFDYNTKTFQRTSYESVTTFWALWAGVSRPAQAAEMAIRALPEFEADGGLLSGTRRSRGEHHLNLEPLAWDYPNGWAIHQMLAWDGLVRYGYTVEAHRLAYKWLYMVTTVFHDYNGVVTDQYDITRRDDAHRSQPHSRIGKEFKGVNLEG